MGGATSWPQPAAHSVVLIGVDGRGVRVIALADAAQRRPPQPRSVITRPGCSGGHAQR